MALRKLKNDILTVEALQGGVDLELRREFNDLSGGVDWGYYRGLAYNIGSSAKSAASNTVSGARYVARATGNAASAAGNAAYGAMTSTRDYAASWNEYVQSSEFMKKAKELGSRAKAEKELWTDWAIQNGINPSKKRWKELQNYANHNKCSMTGKYSHRCFTKDDTAMAHLQHYNEADLKRLMSKVSERLSILQKEKENKEAETASGISDVDTANSTPKSSGSGSKIVMKKVEVPKIADPLLEKVSSRRRRSVRLASR